MKYQPPYGISDPDASYISGDPSIARQGSILPAGAAEYPQREIVGMIDKNNITPSDNDLLQLTRATRSGWINFAIDTGSQNALSVALDPPLTMYRQGLPLRVLIKSNNSGPTTINVNGLGNRPVTRGSGAQLEADDLRVGMIALFVDDGSKFQMVNFQGILSSTSNSFYFDIPYAEDTGTMNNVIGVYSPAITTVVSGDLVLIKVKTRNSAATMFTVNALAPVPITRNDGQPLQSQDIELNEILLLVYNVNHWQVMRLVRSQVQFKLNANLILYVRTDGDDTNGDGSTNDAAHAFKTVQRAVNYVRNNFAIAGRMVTIQLGITGTYSGQVSISNTPGSIVVRGDPANPNGFVIQGGPSGYIFQVLGSGTDVLVQGIMFVLQDPNAHYLVCYYSANLTVDNCSFTGVAGAQAYIACTAGTITILNNIHFYANIGDCLRATEGGTIICGAWYTNFYIHNINFANAFCWANVNATIGLYYGWVNLTGVGYGYKYFSTGNSVVYTASGSIQWLPGNIPGIADASSVYN